MTTCYIPRTSRAWRRSSHAFRRVCSRTVSSRHCARTRSTLARRIIATLGMRMQSGSSMLRTAHIRINTAATLPPRSRRTSTGQMIISACFHPYMHPLSLTRTDLILSTPEDSHVIPGLIHKCYLAKSASSPLSFLLINRFIFDALTREWHAICRCRFGQAIAPVCVLARPRKDVYMAVARVQRSGPNHFLSWRRRRCEHRLRRGADRQGFRLSGRSQGGFISLDVSVN